MVPMADQEAAAAQSEDQPQLAALARPVKATTAETAAKPLAAQQEVAAADQAPSAAPPRLQTAETAEQEQHLQLPARQLLEAAVVVEPEPAQMEQVAQVAVDQLAIPAATEPQTQAAEVAETPLTTEQATADQVSLS